MSLEELWAEMERAPAPPGEGLLLRRIHPEATADLFIGLIKPADERVVVLTVPVADCPPADRLPSTRGTRSMIGPPREDGSSAIELRLTDRAAREVFGALAADVAGNAATAATHHEAVDAWIARLARWQRLLARLPVDGLGPEMQLALYAELWTLREVITPALGVDAAIAAWTGPEPALHDFQHARAAVEVKSTAGAQHQVLQISSERQLDDTGTARLYLVHLSLDARQGAGETLPAIVADRRAAARGTASEEAFEEHLLDAGFADVHAHRYTTAYTLRRGGAYVVSDGFPRIVEASLPTGVGDVRYSIAVSECSDWEVSLDSVRECLGGAHG